MWPPLTGRMRPVTGGACAAGPLAHVPGESSRSSCAAGPPPHVGGGKLKIKLRRLAHGQEKLQDAAENRSAIRVQSTTFHHASM
jgi:hypothetical protein